MHQQVLGGIGKLQVEFVALVQLVEKFINGADLLSHESRVCPWYEIEVVLTQSKNAAWLNTNDGYTLAGIGQ
jgi:hypothetical protein